MRVEKSLGRVAVGDKSRDEAGAGRAENGRHFLCPRRDRDDAGGLAQVVSFESHAHSGDFGREDPAGLVKPDACKFAGGPDVIESSPYRGREFAIELRLLVFP